MRRIVVLGLLVAAVSACATAEDLTATGSDAKAEDVAATGTDAKVAESGTDASAEDASTPQDSRGLDARDDGTLSDATTSNGTTSDSAADTKTGDAKADGSALDTAATDAPGDVSTADTRESDTRPADTATADAGACAIRGCATGTESRSGCANARIIGRSTAGGATGATIAASTCGGVNNLGVGGTCADYGWDHAYRLFMRAGESVTVDVVTGEDCDRTMAQWNATLKIYENSGCADTSCTTRTVCESSLPSISKQFSAPRDGWYIIVVDGMNGYHEGPYTLTVKLTCALAGCECS